MSDPVPPPPPPNFDAVKTGRIKLTNQERIKQEKDGLAVLDDLLGKFAREGFASIPEDDFERMKWYGFYRQRPRNSGFFMQRLKMPGGQYTSAQGKAIAELADERARGFLDVTTRQTFQMHWLKIEDFPVVWNRMKAIGMTTSGACGDDTRNVVGCPVAGVDPHELFDATPFALAVSRMLTDNRDFSNLPRKYKISISGCSIQCAQPDINCLGLFGVKRKDGAVGFGVMVGGGLSTIAHFAQILPIFVPLEEEKVVGVVRGVSEIFRDDGYRANRMRARLKFLMADWGPLKFAEALQKRVGFPLEPGETWIRPRDPESDHFGVNPQKQKGLFYVGVSCLGGRIPAKKLRRLCELAEEFGSGRMRNTNKQNIILLDVPEANLPALRKALADAGCADQASSFRKGGITCTGTEFCNLAVVETKNRMATLIGQLEATGLDPGKIRIHFSGCPSACGQHQIADLGFRGTKVKVDGQQEDAFEMFVGGRMGDGRRFNELVKSKVPSAEVHLVVRKAVEFYLAQRREGESFADFCARTPREQISTALA
ncbi:MAG: nitrite/sulfite reductase [Verrucomicrobiae bacterium]|nr:nitrite/sulfite reductase [Verrucomicrobiae bacterium]